MALTVCMVARDAEKSITAALRSVAGIAQQIVVVDTGSKDQTVALAAAAGAQLHVVHWQDDFSAAQNHALQLAAGDWILWLNPDEELLPESVPTVNAALARDDALAFMVIRRDIVDPNYPAETSQCAQLRLFRKVDGLHWVGRTHAALQPPLEEVARQRRMRVFSSNIVLLRHAYLSPVTEPKLRWAARLLELELQDRPDDLAHLIEYGRTLRLLKDPKAHEVLGKAIALILPRLAEPVAPSPLVAVLLEYILRMPSADYRGMLPQKDVPALVQRWFPASPPLLWALSEMLFANGDFQNAATLLEACINFGRTGQYDASQPFDASILGAAAQMNLGVCYARLRQTPRARECWRACLNDRKLAAKARQLLDQNNP
jgi:tetratricopeptide (TPR) repeat protein